MKIHHNTMDNNGEFYILDEAGKKIAELTYIRVDDKTVNANHTFVDESLQGQGIADRLYQALKAFAEDKQLSIVADCSYVARKLAREKHV